jgi:hypothetical protein
MSEPTHHYREAERLLAIVEASVTSEIQATAALAAIGHAVLATVPPRRAPRRPGRTPPSRRSSGGTASQRWLFGHEDRPGDA